MRSLTGILLPLALTMTTAPQLSSQTCPPPVTKTGDVVDDYHGIKVADPYRWLEDVDAADTKRWVEAENCVSFAFLEKIPERKAIEALLTRVWDYPKFGVPYKEGGRYFYSKNDGLQNQSVLYTQRALTDAPTVLLDPNTLSDDGTVALSATAVSPDGRYLAYATSASGSDWQEFHVRDIATGNDLPDHLRWVKFSGASWTKDAKGFFYSRYDEPTGNALQSVTQNQKLYYHVVGTAQAADRLIFEQPEHPDRGVGAAVSEDGRYAVLVIWLGTDRRNRVYYMDLGDPMAPNLDAPIVRLLDDFDAGYNPVGNDGPVVYLWTDLDAPRGRLIAIDTRSPDRAHWRTVIPQGTDVLTSVSIINGQFVAAYLHDAHSTLRLFAKSGSPAGEIALPTLGSVGGVSGKPDDPEMFFAFTSYLYPTAIYRRDMASGATEVFQSPTLDFDVSAYETTQEFYTSKDGTRIPMFITHKKGIPMDGSNPTYLYGYGGFNISLTPGFSPAILPWLEMGGVYAVPNLRGGAEYGEEWHEAGMHEKKQNVFDDFIAAAEYLITRKYTSTPKLAIAGGSNGGLLVGAVMTQRPELFGAALPAVGVMDMLRFHKFTIGWAWVTEYGSADSAQQFPYLYKYSPYHNIKPGTHYPPTLITTADHDDRVVPGHSFKFAARLQAAQDGPAPILIRIETKAGHGAGKPTSKIIEEQADQWAFLVEVLGMRKPRT
ncbi:MAG: prolyl oligopeptidase family serine peptidase [Candidatus Palauibacterales bacterium]|nr:prolyl oligopeptidase family serine peptidase [Candidatus Palauibacterales bacterium]